MGIPVPCGFNHDLAIGSYHSVSADWQSEGDITIAANPTDSRKFYISGFKTMEGLTEIAPLTMVINPDFSVTVAKQVFVASAWGTRTYIMKVKVEYI